MNTWITKKKKNEKKFIANLSSSLIFDERTPLRKRLRIVRGSRGTCCVIPISWNIAKKERRGGEAARGRKLEARGSGQSSYEISTHLARSQRNTGWPQTGSNPSYPRYVSWDNNDPGRSCKGRRHTVPCHRPSDPPLAGSRSSRDCRTAHRKCSALGRRASCTSTCNNSPWCATEIVLKSEYFSLSLSLSLTCGHRRLSTVGTYFNN